MQGPSTYIWGVGASIWYKIKIGLNYMMLSPQVEKKGGSVCAICIIHLSFNYYYWQTELENVYRNDWARSDKKTSS
jgi:hypothetical protein